jgi:hypothetical protein
MKKRCYYIPANAVKVADKNSDAIAYVYKNKDGAPCAKMFVGKRSKPEWAYKFKNTEQLQKYVATKFAEWQAVQNRKAQYKAELKAQDVNQLAVGDILCASWGYEQTNIDFFEVVESKGCFVMIRKIDCEVSADDAYMTGTKCPLPGQYTGNAVKKKALGKKVKIFSWGAYATKLEPKMIAGIPTYDPIRYTCYA